MDVGHKRIIWISVKDRLPEDEELYLVVVDGLIDLCEYWPQHNTWFDKDVDENVYPTHWMPLPQPPNPEGWYCDGKMHLVETTNDISHECWHRPGPECNDACKSRCQGCANII